MRKVFTRFLAAALLLMTVCCSGVKITRVPPGQSVEVALAKKATAIPTPTPLPVLEGPMLPDKAADEMEQNFTLGNFCLETGKNTEAIDAFEKVVKTDPTYAEAWNKLVTAYRNAGKKDKADEAENKFKALSKQ